MKIGSGAPRRVWKPMEDKKGGRPEEDWHEVGDSTMDKDRQGQKNSGLDGGGLTVGRCLSAGWGIPKKSQCDDRLGLPEGRCLARAGV